MDKSVENVENYVLSTEKLPPGEIVEPLKICILPMNNFPPEGLTAALRRREDLGANGKNGKKMLGFCEIHLSITVCGWDSTWNFCEKPPKSKFRRLSDAGSPGKKPPKEVPGKIVGKPLAFSKRLC